MRKSALVCLLITAFIVLSISGVIYAQEEKTVRVAYTQVLQELPTFVAQEMGFFKEVGLNVKFTEYGNAPLMYEAVAIGRADISSISGIFTVLAMEASNPGLIKVYQIGLSGTKIFDGNFGISPAKLVVAKDSNITSVSQLKGKRIAIYPSLLQRANCKLVLKAFGLEFNKDVEVTELAPPLHLEALRTGQVDALMAVEPVPTLCKIKGVGRILINDVDERYSVDPILSGGAIFSTKFLKENPTIAKKFIQANKKAVDWIYKHPQEAKKILPKYIPIEEEVALKASYLKWRMAEDKREENISLLQKYIDFMVGQGLLSKRLDADKLLISEEDFK